MASAVEYTEASKQHAAQAAFCGQSYGDFREPSRARVLTWQIAHGMRSGDGAPTPQNLLISATTGLETLLAQIWLLRAFEMAHGLRERGIPVRQMPLPAILALVHPQLHAALDTALFGRLPRGLPIMVHDLRRGLAAFRREVVHKAILGGRAYRGRTARSAHAYMLATFVEESTQIGENGDEHEHGDDYERPFAALLGGPM